MGFSLLLIFLLWGVLIALAVWLIRVLFPSASRPPAWPSDGSLGARELLDLRYSRGEISRNDYELKRQTISGEIPKQSISKIQRRIRR
ncbi:amino acid acetyltransferase [Chloroflexota bacterium]